mmetsp:Transcript_59632/g.158551  ORF Transcript_59632/g.158551 Transcript_59632/m.158551 type:complete len:323 (-) Transcript_59632:48-1016(-)
MRTCVLRVGTNMCSMPRLLFACVAGASALHVMDEPSTTTVVQDERRVLLLGCSLDRNALMEFCDGHGEQTDYPVESAWCINEDLHLKMGYIYHPGVGANGDLHKPTALAKGPSTGAILKTYANATSFYMLNGNPHLVVVDSSLWDLLVWRLGTLGGGRPMPEPKEVTTGRVQQWCKHDLPLLLQSVSEVFPTSRVAFRTAPTIDHTPTHEKFEKRDIALLYKCISSSTTNGMLFGKYEVIDYHAIMAKLIKRKVPNLYRIDGYHPSEYPSRLYVNEILRRVGMNPQDPPEPTLEDESTARKARFEKAGQGDANDLEDLTDLM